MLQRMNEDYELSSDTEIDMLLIDLPFELIKESLQYQINNPLSTNVDYVETVVEKFQTLRDQYMDNPDAIAMIDKLTVELFSFIIQEIDNKFDLSINMVWEAVDEYVRVGTALYNFLIMRYKKNVTKFLFKFIQKNKKMLVEEFESFQKKKDVTSINIKKKVKNKDDVLILSNLPSVVKFIMDLDTEPIDFIRYAANDENYEATIIRSLILEGTLLGNFVPTYLSVIRTDYDDIMDDIETDVKMKLINRA